MRFALKSRRGPHVPIAADAPKYLRKEIDRRLEVVKDIKLEPRLINENTTSQESNNPGKKKDGSVEFYIVLPLQIVLSWTMFTE